MHLQHLIFYPALSGRNPVELSLDEHTPRGLFRGAGRNRYLVCDDLHRRFAVALDHPELAPFTMFHLGGLPVDTGTYEGVGKVHLGVPQEWSRKDRELGTLEVDRHLIRLLVRGLDGSMDWKIVAYGEGGAFNCMYEDWTMAELDDMPFFGSGW